jgi:quinol monooxygenase YgiN
MSVPTVGRFVTMTAQPGRGDELATAMLRVAEAMTGIAGCALYAIGRDADDREIIRVLELWVDEKSIAAALATTSPEFSISDVLGMLAGRPEVVEFTPLGGAGVRS